MIKISKTIPQEKMNRTELSKGVQALDTDSVISTFRSARSDTFLVEIECNDESRQDIETFLESFEASETEEESCQKANAKRQAQALISLLKDSKGDEKAQLKELLK